METKGPLWDDSDLDYAPGRRSRKRAHGRCWLWLPEQKDIQAGYLPKSRSLPPGDPPKGTPEYREQARLCREYQRDLVKWRYEGAYGQHRNPHPVGTWAWAAHEYTTNRALSPLFQVSESTQDLYIIYTNRIVSHLGKRSIASTTGADIIRWYEMVRDKRGPDKPARSAAKTFVDHLRRLSAFAVLAGCDEAGRLREIFEALKNRFPSGKARKVAPTWNQILNLIASADTAGYPSIGTATLFQFDLGQRRGDIIGKWYRNSVEGGIRSNGKHWANGVVWSDIDAEGWLTIAQNKSNGEVVLRFPLPRYPFLWNRLQAMSPATRVGPIILSELNGLPWKGTPYLREFKKIAAAAGWPEGLHSMDCRAGAATEIVDTVLEKGIDDPVLMSRLVQSTTGHRSAPMAQRYTRRTDTQVASIADARMANRQKT